MTASVEAGFPIGTRVAVVGTVNRVEIHVERYSFGVSVWFRPTDHHTVDLGFIHDEPCEVCALLASGERVTLEGTVGSHIDHGYGRVIVGLGAVRVQRAADRGDDADGGS